MTSRLVTFRIPEDLYQAFQEKCSDEGQTASEKLRHFVDDYLYPSSQPQAISTSEIDEGEESNAEERFSALKGRITKVEEYIEHLEEPLADILDRLENIEQALPQAVSAGTEDGSKPEPGETNVEDKHLGRVQGNPEEQKEKKEEPGKEKDEGHWPFNVFFKQE